MSTKTRRRKLEPLNNEQRDFYRHHVCGGKGTDRRRCYFKFSPLLVKLLDNGDQAILLAWLINREYVTRNNKSREPADEKRNVSNPWFTAPSEALTEEFCWSLSKVHRLLCALEQKGLIKRGRENRAKARRKVTIRWRSFYKRLHALDETIPAVPLRGGAESFDAWDAGFEV